MRGIQKFGSNWPSKHQSTHYLCSSLCLIWLHAIAILVKTTTLCSVPSSLVQLLQWWKRAAYVSYCPQQLYYRLLGLVSALFFPWCETMDSKVCPCFLHSNTGNKLQQYQSYETLTSRFTVCWPALWSQYQVSTDRPACLNPQTEMRQCGAVSCAV